MSGTWGDKILVGPGVMLAWVRKRGRKCLVNGYKRK